MYFGSDVLTVQRSNVQVERENIGVTPKVTPLFNSKEFNLVRIQIVIPTTWPLTRSLTLPGAMVTIQVE